MANSNLAKMNDIKQYLDDAIKTLVTKDYILKLKDFIEEQSSLLKDLTSKITTFRRESKLQWSISQQIKRKNWQPWGKEVRTSLLEGELVYLESQHELKTRKLDDLEQYGRPECLIFSGFEVR